MLQIRTGGNVVSINVGSSAELQNVAMVIGWTKSDYSHQSGGDHKSRNRRQNSLVRPGQGGFRGSYR